MKISSTARTHVGRRNNNEDAHCIDATCGLYIVADGMGGYEGGEVASQLAVESIREFFRAHQEDRGITWPFGADPNLSLMENMVNVSVRLANRAIVAKRTGQLRQMGSTVAMMVAHGGEIVIGHLGDSRIYRLRGDRLERLTRDHSLYNEMLDSGFTDLPPEDEFPHGNVITRALGMDEARAIPEVSRDTPQVGDLYLLCTDGLLEALSEARIAALMRQPELQEACDQLVQEAYVNGGRDNITAVIARVEPG
ncbi:MAG: serine/threonine protein phosphatase [Myxococcales bacterium]|nr:serine/threonine protein phosphatase [Myxococcales bacterium]